MSKILRRRTKETDSTHRRRHLYIKSVRSIVLHIKAVSKSYSVRKTKSF